MKKQKMTSINSKFFKSMSLLTVAFIIIILVIISTVFYRHFFKLESQSSSRQLRYIAEQLDYYLQSVDNYSKTIMTDSRVQTQVAKYNSHNNTFNAIDQMNIKTEINHIIQSTSFIHSVSLYAPDLSLIATTEIYPYSDNLLSIRGYDEPNWVTRLKYSNKSHAETIQVLSLIRPFYNYSTGSLLGYMEIAIPESTISDIYRDKSNRFSKFFIVDSSGIICSSDGSMTLSEYYEQFDQVIKPEQNNYSFNFNTITFSQYFPSLEFYIVNEILFYNFLKPSLETFGITVLITALCIAASLYVSHKVSKTITFPIYRLISHTQKVKAGNWTPVNESYSDSDSDIGLLFEEFNSMITAQEALKNDLLHSQKMKNEIALELLQQQVNPHFLYNTLDNICSLAELDEKETLIDIVMNLSKFYRNGLSNGLSLITIGKELEITESYLKIMKIRYYNRFDYHITCDESILACPCLKLLLQPVVENSIYHGIKEICTRGKLDINVYGTSDSIVFTIRDNGVGISPESIGKIQDEESGHFGIKNIHNRIQLYYGSGYGLQIANHPDGGCITTITIKRQEGSSNAI